MPRIIQRTLSIPTDSRYLEDLRQFAGEAVSEAGIPPRRRARLIDAVEEAVASCVAYAEEAGYTSELTITVDIDDVRFKAIVTDTATAPGERPGSDAETGKETRRRTGRSRERRLSIPLRVLQQLCDEVSYSYQRGFENRLELLKFL